jgi:hypothetical protein
MRYWEILRKKIYIKKRKEIKIENGLNNKFIDKNTFKL